MLSKDPQPAKPAGVQPSVEPQVFPYYVRLEPSQLEAMCERTAEILLHRLELQDSLELLTEEEVAALHPDWTVYDVRRWTANGELLGIKSGRKRPGYSREEVRKFQQTHGGVPVSTRAPSKEAKLKKRKARGAV